MLVFGIIEFDEWQDLRKPSDTEPPIEFLPNPSFSRIARRVVQKRPVTSVLVGALNEIRAGPVVPRVDFERGA